MMEMSKTIYLLFVYIAVGVTEFSYARVFTPCELAQEIIDEFENTEMGSWMRIKYNISQGSDDFGRSNYLSLPLAVCIAGYRNYNSSYTLVNTDGAGTYGIFGVHSSDFSGCESVCQILWQSLSTASGHENPNLQGDLRCLVNVVLDDPDKIKMYETICSPPAVHKVTCKLKSGLVIDLFDPVYKNLFMRAFETKETPLDTLDKLINNSTSFLVDTMVLTILILLTFFVLID